MPDFWFLAVERMAKADSTLFVSAWLTSTKELSIILDVLVTVGDVDIE